MVKLGNHGWRSRVTSAQVNAWLASHKGSLDTISPGLDRTLEDVALARMMLHRRRAIVAQVIDEFFSGLGGSFAPYLENRAPQAPTTVARELEISKAAGDMAESLRGSVPPPLLFERALLADMEGRSREAQANLDELLKAYPGFLAAATASGTLSLAANDPGRAIRSFACVETELANTREGAALLADALHAVGMHQSASRYDLATLTCPGYADSHGNDCAPVDMFGAAARDAQMPAAVILGELPDGRLLCNDRGLYYARRLLAEQYWIVYRRTGRRILRRFRLSLCAGTKFLEGPMGRLNLAFAERGWPFPGTGVALDGKARVHVSVDGADGRHRARKGLAAKLRDTLGELLSALTAAGLQGLRIANHPGVRGSIYRSYKRLPEPVRYRLNRHVLSPVRRLGNRDWQQILEQDLQSNIYRERVRVGVARMLQPRATLRPIGFESVLTIAAHHGDDVSRSLDDSYGESVAGKAIMSVKSYRIPPAAAEIFNDLVYQQENEVAFPGRVTEK